MNKETVLITGSSKGLGKSLALQFSKKGYNIIIHGRDKSDLDNVKKEVQMNKVNCDVVVGDISKIKTIHNLTKSAEDKNISILINNVAIMSKSYVQDIKDREVDEVLDVNLSSIIKLTTRIYSLFLKKKSGMIINIISTAGLGVNYEKESLYCASKHGLRGFTDGLRIEAKPNGIRVLAVYPAGMWTTFHDRAGGRKNLEKTMKTEEVAKIIFNMVGYDSVHINEIMVDRMYR